MKLEPNRLYQLTRDVVNPKPDKRQKYDVAALVMWPKGARFSIWLESRDLRPRGYFDADKVGGSIAFYDNAGRYGLIADALEPVPECFDAIRVELDCTGLHTANNLLEKLIELEMINYAQLRTALAAVLDDYSKED